MIRKVIRDRAALKRLILLTRTRCGNEQMMVDDGPTTAADWDVEVEQYRQQTNPFAHFLLVVVLRKILGEAGDIWTWKERMKAGRYAHCHIDKGEKRAQNAFYIISLQVQISQASSSTASIHDVISVDHLEPTTFGQYGRQLPPLGPVKAQNHGRDIHRSLL